MNEKDLHSIIELCKADNRIAQKQLYQHYYSYAMTICHRYAKNSDEAKEILNDAFFKVFTKMDKYTPTLSFKGWLYKIIVRTAIDYYRKYHQDKEHWTEDIDQHYEVGFDQGILEQLATQDVMQMVQLLPPAYRTVFNLYVVEHHTHEEIAELLGISEGTSKSNLAKARQKLKSLLAADSIKK